MAYGHWTCLFLVSVYIRTVDVAIPGFHRAYNLQTGAGRSSKRIYAYAATHRIFGLMRFGLPRPETNLWDS